MAGSFTAANFNVAYNATSAAVTLTGLTAGYTFRITTTATGTTIFTGGGAQASTVTSRTISGGTFPAPGGVTTMYLQENQGSGFILSAIASATITRAAVPPPTALNFSDPGTFGTTVTITMSGTGGSGTYEYSLNNSTWTTTNTFTATRGSSYTYYIRSTFGGSASTSISNSTTVSLDTTPTLGNYTNQTGVALSSTITSGTISVTAINAPASISVSGGSYSINGGAFTTANSSVNLNDTVAVQHTSSGSYGTVTSTTVTIGGVGRTFTSTTTSPDTTVTVSPSSFSVAYNADSNVLTSISGATATDYYRIYNGLFGAFPASPGYLTGATTHSNIALFSGGPGANFTYDTQASIAAGGPWVNTGNTITMVKAAVPAPATVSATMSGTAQLADITLSATGGSGSYEYSINGTTWQTSGLFTGLTRNTTITIYARSTYVFLSTTYTSSNTTASYLVPYNEPDLDLTASSTPTTVAYNSTGNLTYSWTGQGSISRYKIQRNDAGTWVDVSVVQINATSRSLIYTEQDIPTPGNSASYKVVANVLVTNGGTGTFADTNISWTLSRDAVPVPSTPSGAAGGGASPTVTITASGGSGSYEYSLNGTSWQAGNTFASQTRGATLTLYTRSTYTYTYDSVTFFTAYSSASSVSFIVPSAPTVNDAQTYLNTAANIINHTVALSANGTGGTLEYAISTSNVYASVTGWQSSATFTAAITRGSTYYMWARRDVYAEAADVSVLQTVPYSTVAADSAVTLTTIAPTTSYVNGTMPFSETIATFTIGSGTSTTQYGLFKNFILHNARDGNGDITVTGGGLPAAGTTATYWIQARLSPNFGGDPNGTWSAVCTGTINGSGTSIQWTMSKTAQTNLAVGTVTNNSGGDLTGASTANVIVTLSSGIQDQKYKLVRTLPTPVTDMAIGSVLGANGSTTLTLTQSESDLPTEGNEWTYKVQVIREAAQNGDGVWYDATGTGVSFAITRILQPTVNDTQIFDTITNSSTISHTVNMKSYGTGGTLQYALSTSATYNTSLIGTWQTSQTFTNLTRQNTTPYYFWARRSTDSGDADGAGPFTVPAYIPSIYGLQVWASDGTSTILAPGVYSPNLLNITTTAGGGTIVTSVQLNFNQTSANLYIENITATNADKIWVVATHAAASYGTRQPVINRFTGYITITSKALDNNVTHYVYAGRVA
jgi:hypothetical protein